MVVVKRVNVTLNYQTLVASAFRSISGRCADVSAVLTLALEH